MKRAPVSIYFPSFLFSTFPLFHSPFLGRRRALDEAPVVGRDAARESREERRVRLLELRSLQHVLHLAAPRLRRGTARLSLSLSLSEEKRKTERVQFSLSRAFGRRNKNRAGLESVP